MSSNNRRVGNKTAPYARLDKNGLLNYSGPYIGVVKNNIDPTCSGRLQVYIPQFGKPNEDDPSGWITVGYASPFRGQTKKRPALSTLIDVNPDPLSGNDVELTEENSFQSYGMWFVPPDINIRVLCTFANGDPGQGYWFACVQDPFDAHMVPGIGSSMAGPATVNTNVNTQPTSSINSNSSSSNSIPISTQTSSLPQPKMAQGGYIWDPTKYSTHADLQDYIQLVDPSNQTTEIPFLLPTTEAVLSEQDGESNLVNVQTFPAVSQTRILGKQGLAFDYARGTTSASSVRENPSQAFGISTPGRLSPFETAAQSLALLDLIKQFNQNPNAMTPDNKNKVIKSLQSTYRAGGHQFVMDDGSTEGQNQGIRIRTAQGNMVLLDDTNGQIYIVNAEGSSWIEMTPSGRIDIYTDKDFSVRAKGDINLHSDQNISLNAADNIYMKSGAQTRLESDDAISLRSTKNMTLWSAQDLDLGAAGTLNQFGTTQLNLKSSGQLVANGTKIQLNSAANQVVADPGKIPTILHVDTAQLSNSHVWWQTEKFDSIVSRAPAHEPWSSHEVNSIATFNITQGVATLSSVTRPSACNINEGTAANQPDPAGTVCSLTINETKYLLAGIAQEESGAKGYAAVNTLGFVGKYQFGAQTLEQCGYIKKGTYDNTPTSSDPNSHRNSIILNNPNNWTGQNGCTDLNAFLANTQNCQELAIIQFLNFNCAAMRKAGIITDSTPHDKIGGYLWASEFGIGNVKKFAAGQPFKDAYGTSIQLLYDRGVSAIQLANSGGTSSTTTSVPATSTPICVVAPQAGTAKLQSLVQTLTSRANTSSMGQCAHYVRVGLEAAGIDTTGHPNAAKDYAQFLQTKGAASIQGSVSYLNNPTLGDIAVIQPWYNPATGQRDKNNYGHICVWCGTQWVSDFYQRDFSIYKSCPTEYLQFQVFRFNWS